MALLSSRGTRACGSEMGNPGLLVEPIVTLFLSLCHVSGYRLGCAARSLPYLCQELVALQT